MSDPPLLGSATDAMSAIEPTILQGAQLYLGDAATVLRQLDTASIDALVTDPPAGISFMGKSWDRDHGGRTQWIEAMASIFAECLRVLRPGAHGLVWALPRTSHWTATALEDAGFEIRDIVHHHFGSGMPKGWNFSNRYKEWCNCESTTKHDLRSVCYADLPGAVAVAEEPGKVLFPSLPESSLPTYGAAQFVSDDEGGGQSGLEGRPIHRAGQGLRDGEDAGSPAGSAERLCAGAHPGGGEDAGATAQGERGGSPPQSEPSRQPSGEPSGVRDASRALDDRALRDGGRCSRCLALSQDFQGFDVALKPATEHYLLVRKPLSEPNVASNVLAHGTGALNIDGCRVGTGAGGNRNGEASAERRYADGAGDFAMWPGPRGGDARGRWPANLVLSHSERCMPVGTRKVRGSAPASGPSLTGPNESRYSGGFLGVAAPAPSYADADGTETVEAWDCVEGCPVAELDRQSGMLTTHPGTMRSESVVGGYHGLSTRKRGTVISRGDQGGASRFFYVAKASTRERSEGLPAGVRNRHPTVKALALMRYLCRLVTPPGGLVLDPFMGSGSTGIAALQEGFEFLGIEQDVESHDVAVQRIRHAAQNLAQQLTL